MNKKNRKTQNLFFVHSFFSNFFKLTGIKRRFVLPVLLGVIATLVIAEIVSLGLDIRTNNLKLKNKGEVVSKLAAVSLVDPIWNYYKETITATGLALFEDEEVSTVRIMNAEGVEIYSHEVTKKGQIITVIQDITKDDKKIGTIELGITTHFYDVLIHNQIKSFLIKLLTVCIILWFIINLVAGKIATSIHKVTTIANQIANDDLSGEIEVQKTNDEVAELSKAFFQMQHNLQIMAEIAKQLANGQFEDNEETTYILNRSGDLTDSFKEMIFNLKSLFSEMNTLIQAFEDGHLDARGKSDHLKGGYQKIIYGLNSAMDALIKPITGTSQILQEIAKGNLQVAVDDDYRGDYRVIKDALNSTINTLQSVVNDIYTQVEAATKGELSVRADISKHNGDFQKIVSGINQTLDAITAPLQETSNVLQQMSQGSLQVSVEGDYEGEYLVMKNALNLTISTLQEYIGETSNVLTKMSEGYLDVSISGDYLGDFIEMKYSLNQIIQRFNEMLSKIYIAAEQVAVGASKIAMSSQNMSQASTEQAATVQEINASITEIANQTKMNALNSEQANKLSISAEEQASNGNSLMVAMLKAMEEINESSITISKIIKVIDEIAFQTNILSLNAAVEAARAGQYGKGFAVVAEEVRNLAGRSAEAAKETTNMIEASIKKVENGTEIAHNTATSLNKIVESISKTATLISEIATASQGQANGIVEVNQGVHQVSQATQINTATAEENATASEQLTSQAEILKNMVAQFKLKKIFIESESPNKPKQITSKKQEQRRISTTNVEEFGKY